MNLHEFRTGGGRTREEKRREEKMLRKEIKERSTANNPSQIAGADNCFNEVFVNDHSQEHLICVSANIRQREK
jgi:hypothetical protein